MQDNTQQNAEATKEEMTATVTHLPKASNGTLFDKLMSHAKIEESTVAAKSTASWSHLMTYPDKLKETCLTILMETQKKAEILGAYGYLDNETNIVINNLAMDLDLVSATADEIKDKHKNFSGRAKSVEEEIAIHGIHSEYMELHDRYQRTVPQSLLAISERLTDLRTDINSGKVQEIKKAAQ